MRSGTWVIILAVVLAVSIGVGMLFLRPLDGASQVEIWSDGQYIETLSLSADRVLTVDTEWGTNVITVRDGKVAVTEADCPDHYCMHRGYCEGGLPIVCLPNRLEIRFSDQQGVDGVIG